MNAIEVHNLTKIFKLYDKPSARLKELYLKKIYHKKFTALDNLSFSVKRGETIGIIGENGVGKSTLLKILAKILSPTYGHSHLNGKVSSLLELGSGLHPEFTGLENIYFYGSLLGIDKTLMQTKVDEIIEFSELGDFINYPIKTYSSGMFVRLAFSVATAVDPDTLIIDEVLSVGDLHFQKKSTDRILAFKDRGKTIVFCSHELYHVARLCDRVIWLKNGRIHMEGQPLEVIQEYETYQLGKSKVSSDSNATIPIETTQDAYQLTTEAKDSSQEERSLVSIRNVQTFPSQLLRTGDDLYIKIQVVPNNDGIPYRVAVLIKTVDGVNILGIGTNEREPFYGNKTVTLRFPKIQLKSGTFLISAYAFDEEGVYVYDIKQALPIKVPRESIEIGIVDLPNEWIIE